MRRRVFLAALAAFIALAGCRSKQKVRVQATEEEPPSLASVVHVADPRVSAQLVSGFYGIEQNAWRWTAGKFSVLLRPPRGAAQNGAVLQLKLSVPDPVIAKLKTVSLSASAGSTKLSPETYTQTGEFTYARDLPATAFGSDAVKIDFVLDKSIPAGDVDQRELGIIVTSVGLEPK